MSQIATITLTPNAYWKLEFLCHKTPNEVSAMGLLLPSERGIVIEDFVLVKQEVGPAHVSLDMTWWADKQIELFDRHGIEPWRTSCWCHCHPAGINQPSQLDEMTMAEAFGSWDFIAMLILTKAGHFYARMDFDHDFGKGTKQRLSVPCAVSIDWANPGKEAITRETLQRWESEFKECVTEANDSWVIFEDEPTERVRPHKGAWLPKFKSNGQEPGHIAGRKEVEQYVHACQEIGFDPNDPQNIDDYFGGDPFGY